jgi:hypothetical protein
MAEEALVESLVNESVKLVEELDRSGTGPTNVLWYYFSDADEWRLLLAGPAFDKLLPKDEARAYQALARAIRASGVSSLTIAEVKLVRTDDALLSATRPIVKTPATGLGRMRFRDSTVNGIFVKEMLIMRAA